MAKLLRDVEEEWADFERSVLPAAASRIQRTEMRKAFISGYWACMNAMLVIADHPDDEEASERIEEHYQDVTRKVKAFGVVPSG